MRDSFVNADPVARKCRRLSLAERTEEAIGFIREFARESRMSTADRRQRETEVRTALRQTGHYDHTPHELAYGSRLAWRKNSRCIGRLWWKALEVVDCRHMTRPEDVAAHTFEHMADVFRAGNIQSRITIFAPSRGGVSPATIESPQVIQYAGYLLSDGSVLGDRKNIELTRVAMNLGWEPPEARTRFDLLPLIVRGANGHRYAFPLPEDLVREVAIEHPTLPGIAALGLKWYAVPCISDMILTIGGIDYPCAPFNGHYMGTEIASRNFVDKQRYDLLAEVYAAIGDVAGTDPLWRDRVLTELNFAVLSSFEREGIAMVDHHTASAQFMQFFMGEQKEGRHVSAEWSWIVPPQASAACPVFHLPMEERNAVPNFYYSRAIDGNALRLDRTLERRSRVTVKWHNQLHRWREWRRRKEGRWSR